MVNYFEDKDVWNKFLNELISWEKTPYRHFKMVKGRGVDCTLLIAALWKYMGIISNVDLDYYPRDWHINNPVELVIERMRANWEKYACEGFKILNIDTRDEKSFVRGDALCFSLVKSGVTNHSAIWIGNFRPTKQKRQMYNAWHTRGVCRVDYGRYWADHLTYVFRIVKE